MKQLILYMILTFIITSCHREEVEEGLFIPTDIVIAHRGTTYWAPEETEMAYRWARNIGAHYLEVDIQRSKDGVLLALHDDQLTRTTNIEEIYPERAKEPSSHFAFEELMKLDAGSWFESSCLTCPKEYYHSQNELLETNEEPLFFDENGLGMPDSQDQKVYIGGGQGISTLEDVIRIAEGYRIAKDSLGNRLYKKLISEEEIKYRFYYVKDVDDKGHRPGVYIETKEPHLFPNVEEDLFKELSRLHWNVVDQYNFDTLVEKEGLVNLASTPAKVILQTFSPESLKKLDVLFKNQVPICFLLWLGDENMPRNDSLTYANNIAFAKAHGAEIIGPSISGSPNNYDDLLSNDNYQWIRNQGLLIHPYSFNTPEQMIRYGPYCDGMFTNLADLSLLYYSELEKAQ